MQKIILSLTALVILVACGARGGQAVASGQGVDSPVAPRVAFSADSAYNYVRRQVEFGPRVPNTDAHRCAGDWLVSELCRHGAEVTEQKMTLTAFDGTRLDTRNIMGRYLPDAEERMLFVAHWDCRPWSDQDPDPDKASRPVDGANDGASGVGVLLEMARLLGANSPSVGVDILFVDAEDWGSDGDEDSWALGAHYFVGNPMFPGYRPSSVIVLDMVGGRNARFPREYFSQQSDPVLLDRIYSTAAAAGFADRFPNEMGGAVTDDHLAFIKAGIPAVDIIDYRPDTGFFPAWHTGSDTMDQIDSESLRAVGQTMINLLFPPEQK